MKTSKVSITENLLNLSKDTQDLGVEVKGYHWNIWQERKRRQNE